MDNDDRNDKILLAIAWGAIFFAFILFLIAISPKAKAHDWYDLECCSERDCAPVIYSIREPNGDLKVSTSKGVGFVTKETKRKPSKDNEEHACMLPNSTRVICFYQPLNF